MAKTKETVDEFLARLEHPLKAEIEAVRAIILNSSSELKERIKWNAPSFYYLEDLLTFHLRPQDHFLLVFHHPEIVKIRSDLLEGDYKDRRLISFTSMTEVEARKDELQAILKQLISRIEPEVNIV